MFFGDIAIHFELAVVPYFHEPFLIFRVSIHFSKIDNIFSRRRYGPCYDAADVFRRARRRCNWKCDGNGSRNGSLDVADMITHTVRYTYS